VYILLARAGDGLPSVFTWVQSLLSEQLHLADGGLRRLPGLGVYALGYNYNNDARSNYDAAPGTFDNWRSRHGLACRPRGSGASGGRGRGGCRIVTGLSGQGVRCPAASS
jgi:hypothetical protein